MLREVTSAPVWSRGRFNMPELGQREGAPENENKKEFLFFTHSLMAEIVPNVICVSDGVRATKLAWKLSEVYPQENRRTLHLREYRLNISVNGVLGILAEGAMCRIASYYPRAKKGFLRGGASTWWNPYASWGPQGASGKGQMRQRTRQPLSSPLWSTVDVFFKAYDSLVAPSIPVRCWCILPKVISYMMTKIICNTLKSVHDVVNWAPRPKLNSRVQWSNFEQQRVPEGEAIRTLCAKVGEKLPSRGVPRRRQCVGSPLHGGKESIVEAFVIFYRGDRAIASPASLRRGATHTTPQFSYIIHNRRVLPPSQCLPAKNVTVPRI